ncbi:hypothetical protein [Actinomadura rupiterrae]|uniref:hypothetical protein n=1 Tax=Actinomadura rupiterrae TaxID=559627 RepID=UPI0020A5BC03|nr:hypothetical protein [Actinomadura rupiterrae]MCP2340650.1 hypothetical protein [Actinomadura rupiterrae]
MHFLALLPGVPLVLSGAAVPGYGAFRYDDVRGLTGYGYWGPPRGMGHEYLKLKICARDVRPDGRAVRMTVALKEPGTPTILYVNAVNHRGVGSTVCSSLVSLGAEWLVARGGTIDRRGTYHPGPWHRLR